MRRLFISHWLVLFLIVVAAFGVRQYRINIPLGDWHSWRQADTAAVSRNFVKEGFDLLHPKYDDMSPVSEESLPNPQHLRFVEFPIYSAVVGLVYVALGQVEVIYGRQTSVVFSLFSIVFLYLLVRKFLGPKVALLSAGIFAFLPYNIYFSRVFLPEPMMIFVSLAALYFFTKFLEADTSSNTNLPKIIFFALTIICLASALLTKPYMLYLALPMLYLSYHYQGFKAFANPRLYLVAFLSLAPLLLWRLWISQYPEGIPRAAWLFNGDNIRYKGAFLYWMVGERLGKEILTVAGFALATIGSVIRPKTGQTWVFHWWLLGVILYVIILARGNVEHDYYQIPLVPILSVMMARGVNFLVFDTGSILIKWISIPVAAAFIMITFALGWYQVRGFYQINHGEIMQAGDVARQILPKDAKVIAPYGGDTAFLYQLDRPGWPVVYTSIDDMIKLGATHYVSVSYDAQTNDIMNKYKIIHKAPNFVIVDLTKLK